MSYKHNCPRCNAPFWHFTGVNTRKFECGSDTQIPSMACRYASQLQERIKQLESWIESLEVLEQHSGILPEREWFGSEIGYLRKGEAVYKGEAKP